MPPRKTPKGLAAALARSWQLRAVADLGRDGEGARLDDERPPTRHVDALQRLLGLLALVGDAGAVVLHRERVHERLDAKVEEGGDGDVVVDRQPAGDGRGDRVEHLADDD